MIRPDHLPPGLAVTLASWIPGLLWAGGTHLLLASPGTGAPQPWGAGFASNLGHALILGLLALFCLPALALSGLRGRLAFWAAGSSPART